jgi:alpha-mannosidase
VQRWIDVSNNDHGVTLATPDAPLVEVGAITNDPRGRSVGWIKQLEPSTTLYSYVMNNYWETNYKASQAGPTTFRYSIRPHGRFGAGGAAKFGAEFGQPLIAVPVDNKTTPRPSFLSVEPAGIIATAFKPAADGDSWIIRLFNPGRRPRKAKLAWAKPAPETVWLSNLAQEKVSKISGPIEMAAQEFITLRASLPDRYSDPD